MDPKEQMMNTTMSQLIPLNNALSYHVVDNHMMTQDGCNQEHPVNPLSGWPIDPYRHDPYRHDPYLHGSYLHGSYRHDQESLVEPAVTVDFPNNDLFFLDDVDTSTLDASFDNPSYLVDPVLFEQDLLQLPTSVTPNRDAIVATETSAIDITASMEPPITNKNVAEPAFTCPRGCRGSFRRPGDYRRHMRKHEKPRYKCAVIDCDRTFYRADKLRDHLKKAHKLKL